MIRRWLIASVLLALSAASALPQFRASGGPANQFNIYDVYAGQNSGITIAPGVGSAAVPIGSRTLRVGGTILTHGQKTLIMLIVGDSISANSGPSPYTPTQANNDNFSIYDGNVYAYQDPVIGASNGPGSEWGILGDRILSAGRYQRIITINPAIGGTTSLDWSSAGSFNHRMRASCLWARSLGWPITGSGDGGNWRFVVMYRLGTNDNAQGTTAPQFVARARSAFAVLQSYGCTSRVLISQMTLLAGVTSPTLQAATASLIDNITYFAGSNTDSLTGATNRQLDGTHLTLTGEVNDMTLLDTALIGAGY